MPKETKPKRPTHTAFMVEGEGDKSNWTEIGAVWSHEDNQGFNLVLKVVPLHGRIVIRQRQETAGRGEGQ